MERNYSNNEEALNVAKRALYLAWKAAGGTAGYGFLQDRGEQSEDNVWKQAYDMGDYSGRRAGTPSERIDADYVFGRMLKLYFTVKGNTINHGDQEPRRDYQAWCGKYPTYAALFDTAESEVLKKAA